MIMSILFYFMIGFVLGAIMGWNKKAYFIGLLILIVLWIAAVSYVGISSLESEVVWWEFLINAFSVSFGINIGRFSYKEAFK